MIVSKVTDSLTVSPGDTAELQNYFTLISFIALNVNLSKQFTEFSSHLCCVTGRRKGKERILLHSPALGSAVLLNKPSPTLQSMLAHQMDYDESTTFRNVL